MKRRKASDVTSVVVISMSQVREEELSETVIPATQVLPAAESVSGSQPTASQRSRSGRRSKTSEACSVVAISTSSDALPVSSVSHPQTPTTPHTKPTKKVKTPLQIVTNSKTSSEIPSFARQTSDRRKASVAVMPNHCTTTNTEPAQDKASFKKPPSGDKTEAHKPKEELSSNRLTCEEQITTVPDSQHQPATIIKLHPPPVSARQTRSSRNETKKVAMESGKNDAKRHKMAELKQKLVSSDPGYTSLPLNTHKVSLTPALSTVSEATENSGSHPKSLPTLTENDKDTTEVTDKETPSDDSQSPPEKSQRTTRQSAAGTQRPQRKKTGCLSDQSSPLTVAGSRKNSKPKNTAADKSSKSASTKSKVDKEKKLNTEAKLKTNTGRLKENDKLLSAGVHTSLYESPPFDFDYQEFSVPEIGRTTPQEKANSSLSKVKTSALRENTPLPATKKSKLLKTSFSGKNSSLSEKSNVKEQTTPAPKKYKFFKTKAAAAERLNSTQELNSSQSFEVEPDNDILKKKLGEKSKTEMNTSDKPKEITIYIGSTGKDHTTEQTRTSECKRMANDGSSIKTAASEQKNRRKTHDGLVLESGNKGKKTSPLSDKVKEKTKRRASFAGVPPSPPPSPVDDNNNNVDAEGGYYQLGDFATLCKGILSSSEKTRTGRHKKQVDYKELSESELDAVSATKDYSTTNSIILEDESCNKQQRKRKRSLISDTDTNNETRSEVSWLNSSRRKKKPRPCYEYHGPGPRKPTIKVETTEAPSDEDYQLFTSQRQAKVQPKKPRATKVNNKKKVNTAVPPQHTEDEFDKLDAYSLYFTPQQAANQPDRPSKIASVRAALHQIEQQSVISPSVSHKTPSHQSNSSKTKRKSKDLPITPCLPENTTTSPINGDLSVECVRGVGDRVKTLYTLRDSPMMVESDADSPPSDDDDRLDTATQLTSCTHISSLRTPLRSHHSDKQDDDDDCDEVDNEEDEDDPSDNVDDEPPSGPVARPSRARLMTRTEDYNGDTSSEDDHIEERHMTLKPRCLFTKETVEEAEEDRVTSSNASSVVDDEPERQSFMTCQKTPAVRDISASSTSHESTLPDECTTSISSFIQSYRSDMQQTIVARKQQVDQCTKQSARNTVKQIASFWTKQQSLREETTKKFLLKLDSELNVLESNMKQLEEAETRATEFFKQQRKTLHAYGRTQEKGWQQIAELSHQYIREVSRIEKSQKTEQRDVKEILRKEMYALQKKLLMKTQQQELMNVKRSLQCLFLH